MKAAKTLIAWNANKSDHPVVRAKHSAPPGSIGIGPIWSESCPYDWDAPYSATGGAAYVGRRKQSGLAQQFDVLKDWFMLVHGYGLHPYIVHRSFLLIDEYQTLTKAMGWGPDRDEPGHDPNVGYGRLVEEKPEMKIFESGGAVHFWPTLTGEDRKLRTLEKELKEAERALGEELSEQNFAWLQDVRAQLAALGGQRP